MTHLSCGKKDTSGADLEGGVWCSLQKPRRRKEGKEN